MNPKMKTFITVGALVTTAIIWRINEANKAAEAPKPTTVWYRVRKPES